jgi:hypothetical protein
LPFGCHGLGLWKLGDVVAGGLQRHKLAPAGQWYRIVESLFPAFGHQANNSAPTCVNFSRITGQMTAFNLFSEFFLEFGDLVSVSLPNAHDLIGSILRDRISLVDEPFHETTMLFHSICRMTFQPSDLFKDLPSRLAHRNASWTLVMARLPRWLTESPSFYQVKISSLLALDADHRAVANFLVGLPISYSVTRTEKPPGVLSRMI